jgi:prepilin-type N-terminal cleavage/methylation domain-containing protein
MRRLSADQGFSLVETLVSISIVAMTMLVSGFAFVRTQSVSRLQGDSQAAAEFASDVVDQMLATPYPALAAKGRNGTPDPGAVAAFSGRLDTGTATAWGSTVRAVGSVQYTAAWFVVPCTAVDCLVTLSPVASLPMDRLDVAVTWPGKECTGRVCVFTTTSLVSALSSTAVASGVVTLPTVTVTPSPTATTPTPTPTPTATTATPTPTPTPTPSPTPGPPPEAIWAATKFSISSASVTITGTVHSNKDISMASAVGTISPKVEYGGTLSKDIASSLIKMPTATKAAATTPVSRNVADYRPGGSAAVAAGSGYKAISCTAGTTWNYSAATVGSATIVYVPCNVSLASAAGSVPPLIVAEGTINVGSSSITIGNPAKPSATGLISNSGTSPAITIAGSMTTIYGQVQALLGAVSISGSIANLRCGVVADSVSLISNIVTVTVDSSCSA